MVYINMPGIYCTGSPPIICNTYDALIVLENNILFNIISLCLHKHNRSYIESIKLTSYFKFSLRWTFSFRFCLLGWQWSIPYPIEITLPFWLLIFICTAYDVSAHVNKSVRLKTPIILTSSTVWFRYDIHLLSFFQ